MGWSRPARCVQDGPLTYAHTEAPFLAVSKNENTSKVRLLDCCCTVADTASKTCGVLQEVHSSRAAAIYSLITRYHKDESFGRAKQQLYIAKKNNKKKTKLRFLLSRLDKLLGLG